MGGGVMRTSLFFLLMSGTVALAPLTLAMGEERLDLKAAMSLEAESRLKRFMWFPGDRWQVATLSVCKSKHF